MGEIEYAGMGGQVSLGDPPGNVERAHGAWIKPGAWISEGSVSLKERAQIHLHAFVWGEGKLNRFSVGSEISSSGSNLFPSR